MAELKLREYQIEGVEFLKRNPRAFLTDEPGLGKSAQVLAAVRDLEPDGVVIVCPAVVIGVWKYEVEKWLDDSWTVRVQPSTKPVEAPKGREILVTSYDRARVLRGFFGLAVFDESHLLKNPKTKRTKRCKELAWRAKRTWLLTGTPILKDPLDFWSQLMFLDIHEAGYRSFKGFCKFFQGKFNHMRQLEWERMSPEEVEKAMKPVSRWHLRRRKADKLDLPPRVFEHIYVQLPKRAHTEFADIASRYPEDDTAWHKWGDGSELARALADYSSVKAAGLLRCLGDFPHSKDDPLVIFSAHKEAAIGLAETLGWPCITGDTSATERTAIADKFQDGEYEGLVATIVAAGVGLTLTRARTCLFLSQTFTPALNSQAEDRIYRISQERAVRVVYVRADNPLEFAVDRVIKRKLGYL